MGIFSKLKKTAADNSDQIEDGIDTAADLAKDKVAGHDDKIDMAADKAKDLVDKVEGDDA